MNADSFPNPPERPPDDSSEDSGRPVTIPRSKKELLARYGEYSPDDARAVASSLLRLWMADPDQNQ